MDNKPTAAELDSIKPGDRVTFRAVTRYYGARKATRLVTDVLDNGAVQVKSYGGWPGFYVARREIIEVHKEPSQ